MLRKLHTVGPTRLVVRLVFLLLPLLCVDIAGHACPASHPPSGVEGQEYDSLGRLEKKTDFKGQITEFAFDTLGRVSEKKLHPVDPVDPVQMVQFTYDELGRQKQIIEARGITEFSYDPDGRIAAVSSPEGTVNYAHDPATGRRIRTWTASSDIGYGYDQLNRLNTVTVYKRNGQVLPEPEVSRYNYTEVGSRDSMEIPNGVVSSYEFNDLNRLTSLSHVNTADEILSSFTYSLAADGRRTNVIEVTRQPALGTLATNVISYSFDELNRLTAEHASAVSDGSGYSAEYSYDLVGNRLEREVTAGMQILSTRYQYNENDQLTNETHSVVPLQAGYIPMRYVDELASLGCSSRSASGSVGGIGDPATGLGSVVGWRAPPSAWSHYGFLASLVLIALAFLVPLAPLRGHQHYSSLPSIQRRLRPILRPVACMFSVIFFIGMSAIQTLAAESSLYSQLEATDWGKDGQETNFSYDTNGSLTQKTTTVNGDLTKDELFSYNLENRMAEAVVTTVDSGTTNIATTAFTYNQSGIRVKSETTVSVNGVEDPEQAETKVFLVDSYNHTGYAQVLEEYTNGEMTRSYVIGDDVLSQVSGLSLQPSYLLYDGHGSTRQLVDASANITDQYSFDAYGHLLGEQAGSQQKQATSLLYAGEQFDERVQSYYLRARYYNQNNGRFNRLDPFAGSNHDPQSLHKYAYCHNDPVNCSDPSGLVSLTEVMITVAIVAVLANIVLTVVQGVRQQVSWLEIGRRVLMNLCVFGLIAGAIFGTGGLAVLAAGILILMCIWGLAQLVAAWPHMSTEDKVFALLIMLTYTVFGASLATAAALNTPPSQPLDWSIVSKSGETRAQHVNTHSANITSKPLHGVFNGDSATQVNAAWAAKGGMKPTYTRFGADHYIIPKANAGWEGGSMGTGKGLHHVHIIVKQGTSSLITGYPIRGPVNVSGAALLPQIPPSEND